MTHIASKLPPGLTCYRLSSEFTQDSAPSGLLGTHRTKAGVWGVLHVRRGRVRYCLDDDQKESRIVVVDEVAIIEPEAPHHEFYRAGAAR